MGQCTNHPDRESFSICRSCGKEYCELCLVEGEEYYYCRNKECQKLLESEIEKFETPEIIVCPNCKCELELTKDERRKGKTICPECQLPISCKSTPHKILDEEKYSEFVRSINLGDILLIKSILDDGDIDYYSYGENFLNVRPLLEEVRIFVNDNQFEEAKELLKNFELKIFGFSNRHDKDYE